MNIYPWALVILVLLVVLDVLVRILAYIDREKRSEFLAYARHWVEKVRPAPDARDMIERLIEYAATLERRLR